MAKKKGTTELILTAIKTQKTLDFTYIDVVGPGKSGKRVSVQVVAYGISKQGKRVIRAWVKPPSVSYSGLRSKGSWRMYLVDGMSNVKLGSSSWRSLKPGFNPLGDDGMRTVLAMYRPTFNGKPLDLSKLSEDSLMAFNKAILVDKQPHALIKPDILGSVLNSIQYHETKEGQAAALILGIVGGHPFQDGNHRTALLAASMLMGRPLNISDVQLRSVTNSTNIKTIISWL